VGRRSRLRWTQHLSPRDDVEGIPGSVFPGRTEISKLHRLEHRGGGDLEDRLWSWTASHPAAAVRSRDRGTRERLPAGLAKILDKKGGTSLGARGFATGEPDDRPWSSQAGAPNWPRSSAPSSDKMSDGAGPRPGGRET